MSTPTQPVRALPEGAEIICFANDWAADPLSKKQVMRRLARRHRVLWINSINNRRPRLARKDFSRALQKLATFGRGLRKVEDNVWVLAPLYLPFHGHALARRFNRWFLGWQIRRALRRLRFARPVTWTYVPTSADVVGTLGERGVVYHCVDEYAAFSDAAPEVLEREQELLRKSNLVVVCSAALLESKSQHNPRTHLVTHGVDYEHFRKATDPATPVPEELRALPRPILGFHGLLADWVDIPLLAELARRRPEWSLVIVGRADTDVSALEGLPNVRLLGHRPYERLPEYLRGFDVALLPFVQNELTIAANPLKLREYLAAGLPVVAAPIPEIARMGALVELASTAEEYERAIARLLAEARTGASRERSDAVRGESWDAKVAEMEALAADSLPRPVEEELARHPALRAMNLERRRHWKGRHSDLYEYRSRAGAGRVLVKVITSGEKLHAAGAAVERERSRLEQLRARVSSSLLPTLPEPLAALPEAGAIVLRMLPGVPLDRILRQRANALLGPLHTGMLRETGARVGQWLAEFHRATAQPSRPLDAGEFLSRANHQLSRCAGALGEDLARELRATLAALCRSLAGRELPAAAVHGDFLPQNILIHSGRVYVTDMESVQDSGAVYHDIGAFAGYLGMLESNPRYSAAALRACRDAFLASCGVQPDDPALEAFALRAAIVVLAETQAGRGAGHQQTEKESRRQRQVARLIEMCRAVLPYREPAGEEMRTTSQ